MAIREPTVSAPEGGVRKPSRRSRLYYGWIVVAVTFLTIVVSAGVRSAPGVLVHPLEVDFGWNRAAISFAVSIGLLVYGIGGPVSGRLLDRHGPRRVMLLGLGLIALSTATSALMNDLWQLDLLWGLISGLGTGLLGSVLSAWIASRWYVARRGLVLGLLGAAVSAGQIVFVPLLIQLVVGLGWRVGVLVLAVAALLLMPLVWLLMRDEPADLNLLPYGATAAPADTPGAGAETRGALRRALRVPEFWLLAGSFFICGATTNGLIGTHLLPHSIDHGIPEVSAAGALAAMGAMTFVGTIASGWLTDRFDPRRLLAGYYWFRALTLFLLPFLTDYTGLILFALVYGFDFITTMPPMITLISDVFGRRQVGIVYGWIFLCHQIGSALAAYLGGLARVALGDYQLAFLTAGILAILAGAISLRVNRDLRPLAAPAQA